MQTIAHIYAECSRLWAQITNSIVWRPELGLNNAKTPDHYSVPHTLNQHVLIINLAKCQFGLSTINLLTLRHQRRGHPPPIEVGQHHQDDNDQTIQLTRYTSSG